MRLYHYLLKVPSWFHEDRVHMIDSRLDRIAKCVSLILGYGPYGNLEQNILGSDSARFD